MIVVLTSGTMSGVLRCSGCTIACTSRARTFPTDVQDDDGLLAVDKPCIRYHTPEHVGSVEDACAAPAGSSAPAVVREYSLSRSKSNQPLR